MNFGTLAHRPKVDLIVCCPEGYWRRGNVQVFCSRYEIPLVSDLSMAVQMMRHGLKRRSRKPSPDGA